MKAALVSCISAEQHQLLKDTFPTVEWTDVSKDRDKLAALGPDLEIVYGNVRAHEQPELPGIKWIHATWTGVENLMRLPLAENGIIVTNTRGMVSTAISEHIMASIYYLSRDFAGFYNASMNREWARGVSISGVAGSHALVLGLGTIGKAVCELFKKNGMIVSGVNSKGTPVDFCDRVYTPDGCGTILDSVDHIIACLPATAQTNDMVNAELLDKCKDGVTVINVGRGNAVNADDLLAAVNSGKVKGAVLDTTKPEPLPEDSPLYGNPNILITAHKSYIPSQLNTIAFDTFIHNMECFLKGDLDGMKSRVDPVKGY